MGSTVSATSHRAGEGDRFRLVVPSDVALLGETVETIAACCYADGRPSRRARWRLCTVAAEALANAMLYGNRGERSRTVTVEIALDAERIVLAVTDEGDGFDPASVGVPDGEPMLDATRGRGLFLIRRLADHVAFNDRGNTIWITLPRS